MAGSKQTRLTFNDSYDYEPAWSPRGARIAFVSNRDGGDIMNADGSIQIRLGFKDYVDYSPSWSP